MSIFYADDQILLASSVNDLLEFVTRMNETFMKTGMEVNVHKTKVMVIERDVTVTECKIMIGDKRLEQVNY